jgi:hypothetical protein
MVYLHDKNPNLGMLWEALELKMLVFFNPFGILTPFGNLKVNMCIWGSFGIPISPVFVYCTNKNLATVQLSAIVTRALGVSIPLCTYTRTGGFYISVYFF